jgi:hypothetical protein
VSTSGINLNGSSPHGQSISSMRIEPCEVPDLELERKNQSLEEALLKQMDMQKKLHEQLEVSVLLCVGSSGHMMSTQGGWCNMRESVRRGANGQGDV